MRFVLIDRIESLEPGVRITGHKQIEPGEDYFTDHFPGFPVVPGVLVLESLAQLGGRLVEATVRQTTGARVLPMLGKVENAKFLRAVRPGDRLDLVVDAGPITSDAGRVTGTASVGGRRVATAAIMYAMVPVDGPSAQIDSEQLATLHAWSDRVWHGLRGGRS